MYTGGGRRLKWYKNVVNCRENIHVRDCLALALVRRGIFVAELHGVDKDDGRLVLLLQEKALVVVLSLSLSLAVSVCCSCSFV